MDVVLVSVGAGIIIGALPVLLVWRVQTLIRRCNDAAEEA